MTITFCTPANGRVKQEVAKNPDGTPVTVAQILGGDVATGKRALVNGANATGATVVPENATVTLIDRPEGG